MNPESNINLNIPLIYVSPVGEHPESAEDRRSHQYTAEGSNRSLFQNKETYRKRSKSIGDKRNDNGEPLLAEEPFDFKPNDNLRGFNISYVNDIYLDDANKLYPTTSNQSDANSFSSYNYMGNIKNNLINATQNPNSGSSVEASHIKNNTAFTTCLGDRSVDANIDDDEIQSFYSAFGDVLLSPEENGDIVKNDDVPKSDNLVYNSEYEPALNNDNLNTSFLLPNIYNIRENSGFLTVNKARGREERRNSVSKKTSTRSRSCSRSRSHSILSNQEELKLLQGISKSNVLHPGENDAEDNKNIFLQVSNEDIEHFSQVSDAEMQDILNDLKEFDPLMDGTKENTIVTDAEPQFNKYSAEHSIESQEKQYICSYCSFAFLRKHDLKRHMARHLNVKNYVCSGYLIESLPIESEIILFNTDYGKKAFSNVSLEELTHLIELVEDVSHSQSWGCDREFLRSDALNRHFKTKMGKDCLQLAFNDFKNGNVYKTFMFLRMKKLINPLSKAATDLDTVLEKDSGKMRDKYIECEILLKDMPMDILEKVTWPMDNDFFEEHFMDIYEKNLQKVIQRRVKLKKKNQKDLTQI